MSIFASQTRSTLPLPCDPPHTVTLQKLTGADLERAQVEHLNATVAGRHPRGWAGVFQQALTAGIATADQAARAQRDPLAGLDRTTIVCCGLKGWSYVDAAGAPLPVTVKAIADIDDEALEFLAVEIMKLTKPALFQAPAEVEAARKNG